MSAQKPEGLVIQEGCTRPSIVNVTGERTVYVPMSIANTSMHLVTLGPRLIPGHLQVIRAAYPAAARLSQRNDTQSEPAHHWASPTIQQCKVSLTTNQTPRPNQWVPPVTLDHLSDVQQRTVRQLLREESNAFGYIPSFNMHIILHDKTSV